MKYAFTAAFLSFILFQPCLAQNGGSRSFQKTWNNLLIEDTGGKGWGLEADISISISFRDKAGGLGGNSLIEYCREVRVKPGRVRDPLGTYYSIDEIPNAYRQMVVEFSYIDGNIKQGGRTLSPYRAFFSAVRLSEGSNSACISQSKILWYESDHPGQRSLGDEEEIYAVFDDGFQFQFTDLKARFQNAALREVLQLWSKRGDDYLAAGNCQAALDAYAYFEKLDGQAGYNRVNKQKAQECLNGSVAQNSSSNNPGSTRPSSTQGASSPNQGTSTETSNKRSSPAMTEAEKDALKVQEYNQQQIAFEEQLQNDFQARQDAMEQMAQLGAAAILAHVTIGVLLFSNLEYDTEQSISAGPGNRVGASLGYNLNPSIETLDIEFAATADYWPFHSNEAGASFGAEAYAGHGIAFSRFTYGAAFRMQGYIGGPHLQLFSRYQIGTRVFNFTDDTDYDIINYHLFMAGPQIRFYPDSRDWSTLRILGLFENQNEAIPSPRLTTNPSGAEAYSGGQSGALFNYSPGLRIEWDKRNRISLGGEALFVGSNSDNNLYSFFIRRRFDQFIVSATRMNNPFKAINALKDYSGSFLSFLQPSLSWLQEDSTGVFAGRPIFNLNPLGYNYVFKLHENLGMQAGLETNYSMATYINPRTGLENRVHQGGVVAPLTLRLHFPSTFVRYHIEGGLSYAYNFIEIGEKEEQYGWETDEEYESFLNPSRTNYRLGIGASFPGDYNNHSISIFYERSLGSVYQDIVISGGSGFSVSTVDMILHRIGLQIALQL